MSALDAIYQVPAIPTRPTKLLATAYSECGGGMAASASVAVARLGGEAHYWGRVGDDALGDRIVDELTAEGVRTATVRRVPGSISPTAAILVAADGERLVCAYNDPTLDDDPSWLPLARIGSFDAVLADVRWAAGASLVLKAARSAGKPAVFDGDIGPVDQLRSLGALATHAIFSEPGLAAATGSATPGEGLRQMAGIARGVVGVTLGPGGFLWLDERRERREPAPAIRAVDTLGAGDVFHGAFTLALGEGRTVAEAARFANAAAAIKCTRFGGRRGVPSRPELEAFLAARA